MIKGMTKEITCSRPRARFSFILALALATMTLYPSTSHAFACRTIPSRICTFAQHNRFAKTPTKLASGGAVTAGDIGSNFDLDASTMATALDIASSNPILASPVFWTTSVLLIIVGMLVAWDTLIERARQTTPPAIATVIDNILMEMGSLGFIGLVLSAALNNPVSPLQAVVAHFSETYLHDEELLLESFHFLHELFFQAAIAYFFGSAFMTQRVIDSIEFASDLAERNVMQHKRFMLFNDTNISTGAAGFKVQFEVDEEELATEDYEDMLRHYQEARAQEPKNIFLRELSMPMTERGTEALVIRERVQKNVMHLPEWFRLDKDLEEAFATEELNLIKISPSTWLPLIPVLALAASVDLSHDVANPGAAKAIASSGYFLATPGVFFPLLALQLLKLGWGLFNFWKMATIKDMLIPRLESPCTGCVEEVTAAPGELAAERKSFDSTPWFAQPVESLFGQAPTNRVQELFGTIGANGPNFYFESIKLHTWLCVATLVAFAFQILPRDIMALISRADGVGLPDLLGPEIFVQASYAVMNMVFLFYVSPVAFMNFAIISCVERAVARSNSSDSSRTAEAEEKTKNIFLFVNSSEPVNATSQTRLKEMVQP
eukprot:scaffold5771_cov171-Amphora_coffeaeformis.AAC.21